MTPKKFIVIYDWGYESSYHEFDTFQEALDDRLDYPNPDSYPIYQLVTVEKTYTLPDGTKIKAKL